MMNLDPGNRLVRPTKVADAAVHAAWILVVDDSASQRELIQAHLHAAGFANLAFAESGARALESISKLTPDLVILDVNMPGMSGLEVCRKLRQSPETSDMPILISTTVTATRQWNDIFAAGASDIVTKPVNRSELAARVCVQLERRLLERRMDEYLEQLQMELSAARKMQLALVPSDAERQSISAEAGVSIGTFTGTYFDIGGDCWGLRRIDEGRIGVYMADFSGHGISAAINVFRLHLLLDQLKSVWANPLALTATLNARLVTLLPRGQFAAWIYGVLDRTAGVFRYCNAGLPPPIFCAGEGAEPTQSGNYGLPLGIDAAAQYTLAVAPLQAGGFLFLRSDGVDDLVDASGERIGADAVFTLVARRANTASAQSLIDQVCGDILSHGETGVRDDISALCIRRNLDS